MFFASVFITCLAVGADEPRHSAELIFPLHAQHNHAPGIAELPGGELLVSWYRGSGERSADDVAVYGSRLPTGAKEWSPAFLMHDTPGFPDCNTCLMVDGRGKLWLFWPVILANSWESCVTHYKVSSRVEGPGSPKWDREGEVLLKPADFGPAGIAELDKQLASLSPAAAATISTRLDGLKTRLNDRLYQRLGWQPRCKPTVLPSGRILLPLYSDTYSLSLMAISDDGGETWKAGRPTLGFGAIQPAVLRRNDGTLVAYMRENGPRDRVRVAESKDDGESWGPVSESELLNPGSGLDGVRLANGHWLLVYNDTVNGRHSLAVSLSFDEGRTWTKTRHLEKEPVGEGSFHYPTVIQTKDGDIHAVYSYFVKGGKSMKHARFNEAWLTQ